jgi:hypothetical protein
MSASTQRFRLAEYIRLVRGALQCGLTIFRITQDDAGRPVLITNAGEVADSKQQRVPPNPWERPEKPDAA